MDLKETDVDARILSYFQYFIRIVEENGLAECFSGPNSDLEKCKLLISCLAPPPVLKADVKDAVRWTNKGADKNVVHLYALVFDKAVKHERHFQQNKRMRVDQQGRTKKRAKIAEQRSNGKKSQPNAKEGAQEKKKGPQSKHYKKFDKKTDRNVNKGAAPTKSTRDPPSPCPKCNVMHWLNDCPKATEEEKVTLREKLRKKTRRGSHA